MKEREREIGEVGERRQQARRKRRSSCVHLERNLDSRPDSGGMDERFGRAGLAGSTARNDTSRYRVLRRRRHRRHKGTPRWLRYAVNDRRFEFRGHVANFDRSRCENECRESSCERLIVRSIGGRGEANVLPGETPRRTIEGDDRRAIGKR